MCHAHLDPRTLMRETEARVAGLSITARADCDKNTDPASKAWGPILALLRWVTGKEATHV